MNRTFLPAILLATVICNFARAQTQAKECVLQAEHYKIVALPLLPRHINNHSQVVGTTDTHGAAIWGEKEGLRTLATSAGFTIAELVSVNNQGQAAGFATDSNSAKHQGFRYADGKMTVLSGSQSRPYAINDAGHVAGESLLPGKLEPSPVLWKDQTPVDLGACCGGAAVALNNRGQIAGNQYDREGRYHAFTWDSARGIQPLGPQDTFSSAIAINDVGHIILDAFSGGMWLYAEGKPTPLQLGPQKNAKPAALNNCDVIVGAFGPYSDAERAFVWDKEHGFHDLNDLIPANSGWTLERTSSINDRGEIAGWGDHKGDDDAGFLLIPQ